MNARTQGAYIRGYRLDGIDVPSQRYPVGSLQRKDADIGTDIQDMIPRRQRFQKYWQHVALVATICREVISNQLISFPWLQFYALNFDLAQQAIWLAAV